MNYTTIEADFINLLNPLEASFISIENLSYKHVNHSEMVSKNTKQEKNLQTHYLITIKSNILNNMPIQKAHILLNKLTKSQYENNKLHSISFKIV